MSHHRYSKAKVRSKEFALPKSLKFLKQTPFVALVEERAAESSKWTVELGIRVFKSLLAIKERSKNPEATIAALRREIKELKRKLLEAEHEKGVILKQHHQFAQLVVQEDGKIHIPRSPKNYLQVAEERGTNLGRPGVQGGHAGLEKK